MNTFKLWALLSLLVLNSSCGFVLDATKAEKISERQLALYCSQEKMNVSLFSKPVMSADENHPWIFDYESNSAPKHLVRIYVFKSGKTELHRMID